MNPDDVARLVTLRDAEGYVKRRGFALSKIKEGPAIGMLEVYCKNLSFDAAEQLELELKQRVPVGTIVSVRIDTEAGPYRFNPA